MIYAGLVVGGPMDGQRYAGEKPWFQVWPTPKLYDAEEAAKKQPPIDPPTTYEWTALCMDANGNGIAVWAPAGSMKKDIIEILLTSYEKASRP